MRLTLAVLAAALVAAASAACSGDDGGDASTAPAPAGVGTTTLTVTTPEGGTTTVAVTTTNTPETRPTPPADQTRWAAQVDDVCRPLQEQIDALPQPANADALETFLANLLPLVRKQVAGISSLKPPTKTEEARRARLFADAYHDLERALTRYLAALKSGDPKAVERSLVAANEAGARTRTYAISLDVTACGGYSSG